MAFYGVYIPPSKAGFEGTLAQCAGSIAAVNIKVLPPDDELPVSGADGQNDSKYEDPEYPPDSPLWLIFTDKSKALDVLRHYKEARLREFPNREQAESYVQFGFESIESLKRYGKAKPASKPVSLPRTLGSGFKSQSQSQSVGGTDSPFSSSPTSSGSGTPILSLTPSISNILTAMPNSNIIIDSSSSGSNSSTSIAASGSGSNSNISLNGERPPFRPPTKQELVEFRKQIETGNYEQVRRVVWENPRYLISSGDTPTSLKEGYRYNAMHICAQCNQALVAELILKTISDRDFTQLYAGKKSSGEMCAALNENLLDYYLNMPDKGRGETPLHFAVKNGHIAVVEVLTSYPQCKSLKNTEGMQPKDIICQRAQNASSEVIQKLTLLLSDPHYVPVLRAVGNEVPPQVGQPFSPNDPPILHRRIDDSDRLNVELKISALAGPMPREQAFSFFRRWKTPPRIGGNGMPLASSPYSSPIKTPSKSNFNKSGGLASGRRALFSPRPGSPREPNGNQKTPQSQSLLSQNNDVENIENNNNCTYKESSSVPKRMIELPSTPMRQMKPDLFSKCRSNTSLSLMDDSMEMSADFSFDMSVSTMNDSFRERHIKNSDIEKGLEVIGRQLARQDNLDWREYWDFLGIFVDIASSNGLARLESYFAAKAEQEQAQAPCLKSQKSDQAFNVSQIHQYLDLFADRSKSNNAGFAGGAITQVMTPYTCVEKSLQVFARRITKTLINNIGNMVSINDTLLSELKRLKSLIGSFKDDARFITVDFSKVHSRIAHLVASYITHSQEVNNAVRCQLLQVLRKLLQVNGDRREHLHCVCGNMLPWMEKGSIVRLPDALKTEDLCAAAWESEKCCNCLWDANLSRKTSRRKRTESLRAQAKDLSNAAATSAAAAALLNPATPNVPVGALIDQLNACGIGDNDNENANDNGNDNHSDDDDDDREDDSFFYECDDGYCAVVDDNSDDEEIFMTPPESRSPRLSCYMEPRYELFIYGKEPTKRDLDVLNAIFNVDIDKEALPFVHAWRTAMESFTVDEMDLFPSPTNVQKSHKPSYYANSNNSNSSIVADSAVAKKVLSTPKLNAAAVARRSLATPLTPPKTTWLSRGQNGVVQDNSPMDTSPIPSSKTVAKTSEHSTFTVAAVSQSFQTPLNKVRGLFSKYREPRLEPSPVAFSPGFVNGRLNRSVSLEESD